VILKQWFAVFFDHPEKWKSVPNDAIREYEALKLADEATKTRAHTRFFRDRYKTLNPDSLLNMRLYEMRAANYAKVYPERISSKLLVFAIVLAGAWVVGKATPAEWRFAHLKTTWSSIVRCL